MSPIWHPYETLTPDDLESVVATHPVVYWPLGLIEHHGWHLPVGFDGLKADRMCRAFAGSTGGVVLPVMWWGGGGGHALFKWTHYQDERAAGAIVYRTVEQLALYGFRVFVLLCGHYPWEAILRSASILDAVVDYPGAQVIYGTEVSIARSRSGVPEGDHAARQETSYGLHLLSEYVRMDSLRSGRGQDAWPRSERPRLSEEIPGLYTDPSHPRFGQLGEDPTMSSAEAGDEQTGQIVAGVVRIVQDALVALDELGRDNDNDDN